MSHSIPTFYSPLHASHRPTHEFDEGQLQSAKEIPERVESVLTALVAMKIADVREPTIFSDEVVSKTHSPTLVSFLSGAYDRWAKTYSTPAAIPTVWPTQKVSRSNGDIDADLGVFASDTATPLLSGTWLAARLAANVALSSACAIGEGARVAFALTRPPGHHASREHFGGYCYLNNGAIAAQYLSEKRARIAILDVDYHHGNGTQQIFYNRSDVFYGSIHADPRSTYPHFSGYIDETGEGPGVGSNLNIPLPKRNTDSRLYREALHYALTQIKEFSPDVLLVSLGLDTYVDDPVGGFLLHDLDYLSIGSAIGAIRLPTLFVFEGGYHVQKLGLLTTNFLTGFLNR